MTQFPKNKLAQLVIASCIANGIEQVVISPGSRNAPLTIGFSNHLEIKTYSIVDERSAAFFALGMAQQLQKPVAIVCTSGSALLNYYPAIAEAFYSNIPLVVISADRPAHLIDIGDGQTIRQENVFENHILNSISLVEHLNVENSIAEMLQETIEIAMVEKGPVHINVPFDEPLYETTSELITLDKVDSTVEEIPLDVDELQKFADVWNSSTKKMVLVGACIPDELLQTQLAHFTKDPSVLVLIENTANVSHAKFINSIDKLIFPLESNELEAFQPDILLSLGGMIVSKKIKQHLRKIQPKLHWHIDSKRAFDTFHCLKHHFEISPQLFFSQFFFLTKPVASNYQQFWLQKKELRLKKHDKFIEDCEFSDLKTVAILLKSIPNNSLLQVSNSAVIRYTQLFDLNKTLQVFCNRGTSGIDGSTSTAIGAAVVLEKNTVFITGDISFFYDNNALWNSYIPNAFRIIVVNNGGGGIFRFIPGPQKSNALDYFETPHNLTAEHLCKMHKFEYSSVSNITNLESKLSKFYNTSNAPKLLEIFTPREINDTVLKAYFNNLKE
ncbi:2-succinyl-5-enolpyruvyl-6-hydroxy-3-cyclohexene-1-carboxylate synthase [Lutibacter agarilyticus]|uniref:2-succinyl-5-enolpyruvyl-6-hydroxy-3-cyclohexene-1-carboxylate synthase n=1 Tax=Lutibacter agarilyticus TaxID=1109740 RepID=A0A238XI48_9FLAO|nr:2-succinyl-5-enolpyruvyl-6-hydroxy-3-cyclohexene-1-carboxylic-acid synthase [Lutibacter agarilyticus]SNR58686.1 2-succinyl-5-enolpyruvyl-6-hydroxy-3-cyclohexene-1-carboxylate synthase [Lutibacter agarilyticus]